MYVCQLIHKKISGKIVRKIWWNLYECKHEMPIFYHFIFCFRKHDRATLFHNSQIVDQVKSVFYYDFIIRSKETKKMRNKKHHWRIIFLSVMSKLYYGVYTRIYARVSSKQRHLIVTTSIMMKRNFPNIFLKSGTYF